MRKVGYCTRQRSEICASHSHTCRHAGRGGALSVSQNTLPMENLRNGRFNSGSIFRSSGDMCGHCNLPRVESGGQSRTRLKSRRCSSFLRPIQAARNPESTKNESSCPYHSTEHTVVGRRLHAQDVRLPCTFGCVGMAKLRNDTRTHNRI
jgi:hypothetical protein